MQQSKAYVIKNATRNLKAIMASRSLRDAVRRAEYEAYRYGTALNARKIAKGKGGARYGH